MKIKLQFLIAMLVIALTINTAPSLIAAEAQFNAKAINGCLTKFVNGEFRLFANEADARANNNPLPPDDDQVIAVRNSFVWAVNGGPLSSNDAETALGHIRRMRECSVRDLGNAAFVGRVANDHHVPAEFIRRGIRLTIAALDVVLQKLPQQVVAVPAPEVVVVPQPGASPIVAPSVPPIAGQLPPIVRQPAPMEQPGTTLGQRRQPVGR